MAIDTRGLAFEKPGDRKRVQDLESWHTVFPDGREVLNLKTKRGREEYKARVEIMWRRQSGWCSLANHRIARVAATFEHTRPKGAGGAWRDDRVFDEHGEPMNSAACWLHNSEKGSKHG